MDILLVILAFASLLVGLLGAVVPVLPGLPLSYLGLLFLQWSGHGNFSQPFLWVWAGLALVVTVADYFLPSLMTKRFGGSRLAGIGSFLGLVLGIIFFAPLGIILGPFLGALAGELVNINLKGNPQGSGPAQALKVAFGAFLAFIFGAGIKLMLGMVMIYYAMRAMLT